jgi:hypothetical protein
MSTHSNVEMAVNGNTVPKPGNTVSAAIEPAMPTHGEMIPTLKDRLRNDNDWIIWSHEMIGLFRLAGVYGVMRPCVSPWAPDPEFRSADIVEDGEVEASGNSVQVSIQRRSSIHGCFQSRRFKASLNISKPAPQKGKPVHIASHEKVYGSSSSFRAEEFYWRCLGRTTPPQSPMEKALVSAATLSDSDIGR